MQVEEGSRTAVTQAGLEQSGWYTQKEPSSKIHSSTFHCCPNIFQPRARQRRHLHPHQLQPKPIGSRNQQYHQEPTNCHEQDEVSCTTLNNPGVASFSSFVSPAPGPGMNSVLEVWALAQAPGKHESSTSIFLYLVLWKTGFIDLYDTTNDDGCLSTRRHHPPPQTNHKPMPYLTLQLAEWLINICWAMEKSVSLNGHESTERYYHTNVNKIRPRIMSTSTMCTYLVHSFQT
ncbi:hypothetical protein BKA70DRAFT_587376 [Coprinopsis sp. MPI-PUGE-AT-0042]|nr:hypothetical protein BKA70DRAFT_587376 [Coprinopsis sp. MPI-PUGE-AT-0042]